MPRRIAACLAFLVFATCLVAGIQADNTFVTTVARALVAMVVTFVIGLVLGAMGQRMLDEDLRPKEEKLKEIQSPQATEGR
jgi:tetrahydromethanopterin S-methyltransferase subunit C